MRIIYLGSTKFSKEILDYLFELNVEIIAIAQIPKIFKISYNINPVINTNFYDLKEDALKNEIPYYLVDNSKNNSISNLEELILESKADLILAIGWYYMIPSKIRNLTKYGAWGIHASLLPNYAGGAPLVWAMINGEQKTGVTLFKMDDGVDDGDIIAQKEIIIEYTDTIKEVYRKATDVSKLLLKQVFSSKKISFKKQNKQKIKIYPQRQPSDGKINLKQNSTELYNFIRAQSEPYPGAYIETIDGKKLIIEKARIEEL